VGGGGILIWGRNRAQFPPELDCEPSPRVCSYSARSVPYSEVEAEIIVFTKYINHAEEEDGDDETALLEGKQGLSGCTAWLCRRPMSQWERLVYFLRLSAPEEGAMWIRIQVKPMTMRYGVDKGELRTRPVNVVDCHAQTALFVNPFIKLYQVRR
jgi:hypothetical protein